MANMSATRWQFLYQQSWYYSDLELEANKYCDTGDLLYAWSASFGPRIWLGDKVIFHYHIWKVVHNPALIDQKFLFMFSCGTQNWSKRNKVQERQ